LSLINQIHLIAKERDGRCLSNACKDAHTILWWECEQGHRWEASAGRIMRGSWCPICIGSKKKKTIGDMQSLAKKNGGKCVSKTYEGSQTKLLWKCTKGHEWVATPASVSMGSWCPICAGNAKPNIEDMQKVADERGGKCLSETYINSQTKLQWECSEGHLWDSTPNKVKNGGWCPTCYNKTRGDFSRLTIEEMHQIADECGGRCLSRIYINNRTKLMWECSEGHTWEAAPSDVKKGTWCPKCYVPPLTKRKQERAE
jgi:hypothetical protein